ncbi:nitrate/nitrite transporter NarK [Vibrio navarrensis]|uniref:Nitrate/nitrite transporter n=2 Tax=Vibrio navarrensis TaxID=29495 RepID=A0A099LXG6_9VIBR|nr:nitrate/nitrite transporter NarK [Vibrio navarrensis]KGK19305.1 nitrate/nitrite transporter NarK [Vibrio navarrensis]MBE4616993.1 nitrate/nitrite transporter [Vibrio navarrensis]QOD68483.1 NarK family nitrate/nitrite MFS transporter [Vibrio navarrensis]
MESSGRVSAHSIKQWFPEDRQFWLSQGQYIAKRNLWISIPCLLLSFCVWMIFSAVAVNLPKVGFSFTTEQLFLLTALPSVSGAIGRIPYSFTISIFGGRRWTAFSTLVLVVPMVWLGIAISNPHTSYSTFVMIALLCGLGGANFASSMANISFFYPKEMQGSALGLNGGLGNLGVSVMQLVVPIAISVQWFNSQSEGLQLQNAAWVWVPFIVLLSVISWFGMNDIESAKASFKEQVKVLRQGHLWLMSLLYLSAFGSFIGFSAGFAMLSQTQFPDVDVLKFAFIGPLIGALMRPVGGAWSDKFGGIKVTFLNFVLMALLTILIFFTTPSESTSGSFVLFLIIFMGLFACAGIGSGSTFQMIAVLFRRIVTQQAKMAGLDEEVIARKSGTDTAAALGFISAIGAFGGFFIPQAFGLSLSLTGSASSALILFLFFYVVCSIITWFVYGRNIENGYATKK